MYLQTEELFLKCDQSGACINPRRQKLALFKFYYQNVFNNHDMVFYMTLFFFFKNIFVSISSILFIFNTTHDLEKICNLVSLHPMM